MFKSYSQVYIISFDYGVMIPYRTRWNELTKEYLTLFQKTSEAVETALKIQEGKHGLAEYIQGVVGFFSGVHPGTCRKALKVNLFNIFLKK